MALNDGTLNSYTLNAGALTVIATGSGSLSNIEQNTVIVGSGSLANIEQDINFFASGNGSLSNIEQQVQSIASGSLINIEQLIYNAALPSHLTRTGWDCVIVIGGTPISTDKISGQIRIVRSEGAASLAEFTLIPAIGVQDLPSYEGKSVTIDIRTTDGNFRAYTGVVDITDVDILQEKIKIRCTDRRKELINSSLSNVVANIGYYSETIFGKEEDTFDALEKRLTTVPQSLDFDAYGNYRLTNWVPKGTADYTFTDSDLYYDRPRVELISRGRITNRVNIQVNYGYLRNHQRELSFGWTHSATANPCLVLTRGYSLTKRQMVEDAARASGWIVTPGGITYQPLFSSGWYSCEGGEVGWSTQTTFGAAQAKKDVNGNVISDSSGNPVYEKTERTRVIDYSAIYCMGASWRATKRWTQSIVEQYTLTVESTSSQSVFGVVEEQLSYQLDSTTDTTGWESNAATDSSGTYYTNNRDNTAELTNVINTALNVGKTMILMGHRENRAMGRIFIKPILDLRHTVEFSTGPLDAIGKVTELVHTMNVGSGEATTDIEISMYKTGSGGSDSSFSMPSQPSDSAPTSFGSITLGNSFGNAPTDSMTGMIGNAFVWVNSAYGGGYRRTEYQEQFRVDTPEIEDAVRKTKILSGSQTYNVAIPTGTLTVTFDGK